MTNAELFQIENLKIRQEIRLPEPEQPLPTSTFKVTLLQRLVERIVLNAGGMS